jgi:hypothetical protein
MKLSIAKPLAASAAGAGVLALAVGCTSPGSPGGAVSPGTVSPGAAAAAGGRASPGSGTNGASVATASPGAGTGAGATPPSAAGVPGPVKGAVMPCPAPGLKVAKAPSGAAAGSAYFRISFTNASRQACTLTGFPGVALTTGMEPSSQVGAAATRAAGQQAKVITLVPGGTASATLQVVAVANYPSAMCGPAAVGYLQVYPPGLATASYLPYTGQGCSKPVFVLGIMPVVAGAGG